MARDYLAYDARVISRTAIIACFSFFLPFFLEVDSRPYNTVYSLDYIAPQSDSVTYIYISHALCAFIERDLRAWQTSRFKLII